MGLYCGLSMQRKGEKDREIQREGERQRESAPRLSSDVLQSLSAVPPSSSELSLCVAQKDQAVTAYTRKRQQRSTFPSLPPSLSSAQSQCPGDSQRHSSGGPRQARDGGGVAVRAKGLPYHG